MSNASTANDWTKPAATAIPKEGYFALEQGRYGPTYPRTPACHGFTIIAKIKPGTEGEIRAYGKRIEDTIAAKPHALAPLQLHYLRWVLFFVFGLDHLLTEQEASTEEIEAVREWLTREGTCLVLGPHHDVGISADLKARAMEYAHHGDALVPRQQRFGKYTRSLMAGLGVPVENRYGLRPGVVAGTSRIAPLTAYRDLDTRGWLNGVSNFSFHKHLPHYAVTTEDTSGIKVLATQPIDLSKPHPFTKAGNREFNSFVWMPPKGPRAGEILLADSTVFSTLFGADESLKQFWKNLATAKVNQYA
jgi:hypothetical protein